MDVVVVFPSSPALAEKWCIRVIMNNCGRAGLAGKGSLGMTVPTSFRENKSTSVAMGKLRRLPCHSSGLWGMVCLSDLSELNAQCECLYLFSDRLWRDKGMSSPWGTRASHGSWAHYMSVLPNTRPFPLCWCNDNWSLGLLLVAGLCWTKNPGSRKITVACYAAPGGAECPGKGRGFGQVVIRRKQISSCSFLGGWFHKHGH